MQVLCSRGTGVNSAIKLLGDCLVHLSDGGTALPTPGAAVGLDALGHDFLVAASVSHLFGDVLALPYCAPHAGETLRAGTDTGADAGSPVAARRVTHGRRAGRSCVAVGAPTPFHAHADAAHATSSGTDDILAVRARVPWRAATRVGRDAESPAPASWAAVRHLAAPALPPAGAVAHAPVAAQPVVKAAARAFVTVLRVFGRMVVPHAMLLVVLVVITPFVVPRSPLNGRTLIDSSGKDLVHTTLDRRLCRPNGITDMRQVIWLQWLIRFVIRYESVGRIKVRFVVSLHISAHDRRWIYWVHYDPCFGRGCHWED